MPILLRVAIIFSLDERGYDILKIKVQKFIHFSLMVNLNIFKHFNLHFLSFQSFYYPYLNRVSENICRKSSQIFVTINFNF